MTLFSRFTTSSTKHLLSEMGTATGTVPEFLPIESRGRAWADEPTNSRIWVRLPIFRGSPKDHHPARNGSFVHGIGWVSTTTGGVSPVAPLGFERM